MEQRPLEPGDERILHALSAVRTAAYVLRDLDFRALDDLDRRTVAEWELSLSEAGGTLLSALTARGGRELEVPARGQLDRFDEARVARHVQGISKAILTDFERLDGSPGSFSQMNLSILLGLLYSLRGIEQFLRWLDPVDGGRARLLEAARRAAAAPPPRNAPQAPPATAKSIDPAPAVTPPAAAASLAPAPPPATLSAPVTNAGGVSFDWRDDLEQAPGATPAERAQQPTVASPPLPRPGALEAAAAHLLPEAARSAASPAARPPVLQPARPMRRDVDLGAFLKRPDENAAAVRVPPISVFHASSRGPELARRARCLDATAARELPDGVAFALADGPDASLGASIAAIVATETCCEILAAQDEGRDARTALVAAAEAARRRLDELLGSLIDSADDSKAILQLTGALPSATVRRVLEHTREPDPKLKHVTPAFAISLATGLLVRTADGFELSVLAAGDLVIELKRHGQHVELLLPAESARSRFGPGAATNWIPEPVRGPFEMRPGDLALVGSGTLRRGFERSALEKLAMLSPAALQLASPQDDHALQVLREASLAADRYEAIEERRARSRAELVAQGASPEPRKQPLFAGDLSLVLLAIAARSRTPSIVSGPAI